MHGSIFIKICTGWMKVWLYGLPGVTKIDGIFGVLNKQIAFLD